MKWNNAYMVWPGVEERSVIFSGKVSLPLRPEYQPIKLCKNSAGLEKPLCIETTVYLVVETVGFPPDYAKHAANVVPLEGVSLSKQNMWYVCYCNSDSIRIHTEYLESLGIDLTRDFLKIVNLEDPRNVITLDRWAPLRGE